MLSANETCERAPADVAREPGRESGGGAAAPPAAKAMRAIVSASSRSCMAARAGQGARLRMAMKAAHRASRPTASATWAACASASALKLDQAPPPPASAPCCLPPPPPPPPRAAPCDSRRSRSPRAPRAGRPPCAGGRDWARAHRSGRGKGWVEPPGVALGGGCPAWIMPALGARSLPQASRLQRIRSSSPSASLHVVQKVHTHCATTLGLAVRLSRHSDKFAIGAIRDTRQAHARGQRPAKAPCSERCHRDGDARVQVDAKS